MLTEFRPPPAKPEPRQHHLSQTKRRTEAREETNSHDSQQIEENIHEDGVDEAKSVQRLPKDANRKRTNHHIGRQPLCLVSGQEAAFAWPKLALSGTHHAANVEVRSIGLLFCWHSLNPALLDVEPPRQSLYFRIQRIPIFKTFPRNCIVTINVDRGVAHGWSLFEIGVDTTEHDYGTALLPCKCEARIIRSRYQRLVEERQAQRSNKIKKKKKIRAKNTS